MTIKKLLLFFLTITSFAAIGCRGTEEPRGGSMFEGENYFYKFRETKREIERVQFAYDLAMQDKQYRLQENYIFPLQIADELEVSGPSELSINARLSLTLWHAPYDKVLFLVDGIDQADLNQNTFGPNGRITRLTIDSNIIKQAYAQRIKNLIVRAYEVTRTAKGKKIVLGDQILHAQINLYDDSEPDISIVGPKRVSRDPNETPRATWTIRHPANARIIVSPTGGTITKLDDYGSGVTAPNATQTTIDLQASHWADIDEIIFDISPVTKGAFEPQKHSIRVGDRTGIVYASYQNESFAQAASLFGDVFARSFYCVQVQITNTYEEPVRVSSGSIELYIRYATRVRSQSQPTKKELMLMAAEQRNGVETVIHLKDSQGAIEDSFLIWGEYRNPMNFGALLSSFQADQRDDIRSRAVRWFEYAGVLGTALIPLIDGGDYETILNIWQGPAAEALKVLLLEELVANLATLNAMAMPDELEVPGGKTKTRYVFFPRGEIFGVFSQELPVYIMEVDEQGGALLSATLIVQQKNAEVGSAPSDD